jgi:hypothetical protein
MEAFLEALEGLIDTHSEDLTVVELIGALQFTQQRLAFDLFTDDTEDDAEA